MNVVQNKWYFLKNVLKNKWECSAEVPDSRDCFIGRYNLYDRAPVNTLQVSVLEDYYRHLKTLSSLVTNQKSEVWFKLLPGKFLLEILL